ncbi:MAG TPA: S53 family peptidase [Anaerolineales bacterium]|nr:S53 family peptidase [Anaerolineales bacterium]
MKAKWFNTLVAGLLLGAASLPISGSTLVLAVNAAKTAMPFVEVGPQVYPADAASAPDQTLFTCQVGLLPGVVCYDPFQMRHAYHIDTLINAGYTGAGRTIVIVDSFQSPTLLTDLGTFDTTYGLPDASVFFTQVAPDGLTAFDSSDPNMVGWSQEITLDVEWAHAIAPDAKVVLDLAKSNDDADILSATKYAVDNHLGDVISQSFGENESCVDSTLLAQEHKLFVKATLLHITLLASSGDQGAAQQTCDGSSWVQAASSPASDPLVTSVGGTELHAADYCLAVLGCDPTANPAPGTYQSEIAWNEFNSESTGGGFSVLYNSPIYQRLVTHSGKQRGVPDVAYNAAIYHGVLVNYTGHWYLFGGTSCGSPQWAGIVAIADQKAGHSLGFINPALYLFALSQKTYSKLFNDVTSGTNSVVETDASNNPVSVTGFNAGTGWDATTGLGSPMADQLVSFLVRFTSDNDARNAIPGSDPFGNGHHGHHFADPH